MAYYNPFPVGYQPYNPYGQYQQIQQPQQMPQAPSMPGQPAQSMTPPTIHAEIVQVDSEQAAAQYPVGAGASQMMIAKDDSAIFVKTAGTNGTTLDVFVKRPPAPPEPQFDPAAYVTREELETRLAAILPAKTGKKKETAEE